MRDKEYETEQRSENQIHVQLWAAIAGLKEELCELKEARSTVINIEHVQVINIGGNMPLDLKPLLAEVTEDTTFSDVLDTVVDKVVAAYSGATSQADIDAISATLKSNTTRQKLKAAALENLVAPGTGGGAGALAASWNGPASVTVGQPFAGSVVASGGTAPYSYTGSGPAWLTIAADGSASGTPDVAGEVALSGSVTDSRGATAQWSGTVSVS